ncbi:MAG TPA: copper resistance protein CopC [Kineosporiaceae bacterium]
MTSMLAMPVSAPGARRTHGRLGQVLALVAATLVGSAMMIWFAGPAGAHAELVSSDPASGARLAAAPARATLRFTESVQLVPDGIRLLDAAGRPLALGRPGQRGDEVTVDLPRPLPAGGYVLTWRVISADSHPVSGAVPFAVGDATAPAAVAPPDRSAAGRLLLTLIRWAGYVGVVLLTGTAGFLIVCWPGGASDVLLRRSTAAAASLLAVLAAAAVPVQAANAVGQTLSAGFDSGTLTTTLATTFGQAALARCALAAAVAVAVASARVRLLERPRVLAAVTVPILVSLAVSGHAFAGPQRNLAVASHTLHLLAMAVWLGGLVVLAWRVLPHQLASTLQTVLPRWSALAMTCVAVLVVTGTYQSWQALASIQALLDTGYGRLLTVKILLVAATLALGNLGRRWIRHHLPSGHQLPAPSTSAGAAATPGTAVATEKRPAPPVRALRRSVLGEVGLAAVVLAVTAHLAVTTPARSQQPGPAPGNDGPVSAVAVLPQQRRVQITVDPPLASSPAMTFQVTDAAGHPLDALELRADAALPDRGIGQIPLTVHHTGLGTYAAHGAALPLPGRWQITVTVRTTDTDAGVGTATISLR